MTCPHGSLAPAECIGCEREKNARLRERVAVMVEALEQAEAALRDDGPPGARCAAALQVLRAARGEEVQR